MFHASSKAPESSTDPLCLLPSLSSIALSPLHIPRRRLAEDAAVALTSCSMVVVRGPAAS
eukprot:7249695-Alexandrium_andersonii.AAC.1